MRLLGPKKQRARSLFGKPGKRKSARLVGSAESSHKTALIEAAPRCHRKFLRCITKSLSCRSDQASKSAMIAGHKREVFWPFRREPPSNSSNPTRGVPPAQHATERGL